MPYQPPHYYPASQNDDSHPRTQPQAQPQPQLQSQPPLQSQPQSQSQSQSQFYQQSPFQLQSQSHRQPQPIPLIIGGPAPFPPPPPPPPQPPRWTYGNSSVSGTVGFERAYFPTSSSGIGTTISEGVQGNAVYEGRDDYHQRPFGALQDAAFHASYYMTMPQGQGGSLAHSQVEVSMQEQDHARQPNGIPSNHNHQISTKGDPSTSTSTSTSTTHPSENYKLTLRRNQACLQCRRRKLKCDAGKPVCKTCKRSHAHAVRTNSVPDPVLECTYDDAPDHRASAMPPVGGKKKKKSEADAEVEGRAEAGVELGAGAKVERSRDVFQDEESVKKRKLMHTVEIDEAAFLNRNGMEGDEIREVVHEVDHEAGRQHQTHESAKHNGFRSEAYPGNLLDHLSTTATSETSRAQVASVRDEEEPPPPPPPPPPPRAPSPARTYKVRSKPGEPSIHELGIGAGWSSSLGTGIPYDIISPIPQSIIRAASSEKASTTPEQHQSEVKDPIALQDQEPDKVLMDILYPGWPGDLPCPDLMEHMIDTFFQNVPTVNRIFCYDSFRSRMTLSPSHYNFPNEAILHAICAASARYTARVQTSDPCGEPWKCTSKYHEHPALDPDFGTRHSLFAKRVIDRNLAAGHCMYESAQALAILSFHYHSHARWVEGWVGIGMLGRIIVPLGLMNDSSIVKPGGAPKQSLMEPARDDIEREERRALLWTALIYDVQTSAASGWAGGIQIDEITSQLPAGLASIESGFAIPENDQTARSPDLFTRHPVLDGFLMHVKAHILLHRVGKFCRLWKTRGSSASGCLEGRDSKEFKELDGMIGTFVLTFPPALRNPLAPMNGRVGRPLDIDLFGAQVLLYQMAILLHEPFANLDDPDDMSTRRLISAARGILKMVYLVTSTSLDLCILIRPILGFWTAARTLVLFLKYSLDTGNFPGGPTEILRSEIEVFRLTFVAQATRFPIGARHVTMLETLIDACQPTTPGEGGDPEREHEGHMQHSFSADAVSADISNDGVNDANVTVRNPKHLQSSSSPFPLSQLLDQRRGFVGVSSGSPSSVSVGSVYTASKASPAEESV